MTAALWVLCFLYAMIALRWLIGAVQVGRAPLDAMRLPARPERSPAAGDPTLSVLIAAHNEGDHVEDCIRRLCAQNYALHQIIVVNDRSQDATGEVVARIAQHDRRIVPVEIRQLPDGWIGKTHALSVGAARASGDYLLFIDSDVFLRPGAIAAVMDKAARDGIDFLTLWPRLGLRSPADRIMVPAAGWLLTFWSLLGSGATAHSEEATMGNGQFLLMRRKAYRHIGGHEAVRAELAEDAMLAENARRAGLRSWVGLGAGLYVAARNSTFARCSNGLARVLIGSLCKPWKLLFSTQILLGACIAPFWIAPLAAGLGAAGFDPALCIAWTAAAVAHAGGMFATLRRLFALTLEERGGLWLFPIGCVLTVGLLVWGCFIMTGRGTIRWGATRYTVRGSRILSPVHG